MTFTIGFACGAFFGVAMVVALAVIGITGRDD